MSIESFTQTNKEEVSEGVEFSPTIDYQKEIEHFVDANHSALLGAEIISGVKEKAIEKEKSLSAEIQKGENEIIYNKYKKSFFLDNEAVTLGQIVASRHFYEKITIPENTSKTFEGKKLLRTYKEYTTRDTITESLNKDLAQMLSEKTKHEDLFKSKAYEAIANREKENEQIGVIAEKMMQGIAEMISLDRSDLHLEVRPANAFQDVEEKIDFIISTKQKKRGVGVETKETEKGVPENEYEEKNFGIQFTVNTSKTSYKTEQIEKAKNRASDVDDILLVTIDSKIIKDSLTNWEKNGRKIHGPWEYMPNESKRKIIETLFGGVLKPEEVESLQKGLS